MRVSLLLADAAQTDPGGKAHIIGAGWTRSPANPTAMAVVIFIELEWNECNTPLRWKLELLQEDGEVVELPGPGGPQALAIAGQAEAGHPAGMKKGSPVQLNPVSVNVPPTQLAPGRYEWRFTIEGKGVEAVEEHRSFDKMPPGPGDQPAPT